MHKAEKGVFSLLCIENSVAQWHKDMSLSDVRSVVRIDGAVVRHQNVRKVNPNSRSRPASSNQQIIVSEEALHSSELLQDEDGVVVGDIRCSQTDCLPSTFTVARQDRGNLMLSCYVERKHIQENEI